MNFSRKNDQLAYKSILLAFVSIIIFFCLSNFSNREYYKNKISSSEADSMEFTHIFSEDILNQWCFQQYSFEGNRCEMSASQISQNDFGLTITVEPNCNKTEKPYKGGEIASLKPFKYGLFTVSMKNDIVPGTISSFFIMNEWKEKDWEHKEIDIEFLGKEKNYVYLTVHHYKNKGKDHVFYQHKVKTSFNTNDGFHLYSIYWHPDSISWFIDGQLVYTEKRILINEDLYIRMNHWAIDINDKTGLLKWAGALDKRALPSKVHYHYVNYIPLIKLQLNKEKIGDND